MDMSLMNSKLQLILQLLLLPLSLHHHFHVTLLAASNCNASSCANLGNNIPYPFAASTACARSSSFLLSGCSSPLAYWDAFPEHALGPPAVIGIATVDSSTYINLTWDSDLISQPLHTYSTNACSTPPLSFRNLSSYTIPPSIDLSIFADTSVRFSSNNVYFLFNCTKSTSNDLSQLMSGSLFSYQIVRANSTLCQSYRNHCTQMAEYYTAQCVQLSLNRSNYPVLLSLQKAMDALGCSHFQFFLTRPGADNDVAITEWSKGILQLQWRDRYCWNCLQTSGSCVVDSINQTFKQCNCEYGVAPVSMEGYCFNDYCSGFSICDKRVKIGVSVVVIVGTLLVLLAFYCWRRNTRKRSIQKMTEFPRKSAWPHRQDSSGSNDSLNDLDLNSLSERPMEYSYTSMASATSSFSSIVGKGGFGVVFKGALDDQPGAAQEIAVKVLEATSKHSRKQFLNEVAIIGRIHHVNVVRLLGFCVQQEEHEMLVYEYVENGSLDRWLFGSSTKRRGAAGEEKELEWGQRYGIALGVAKGLSYLHEECRHRIVHCDIKPQNILLDACMCPKIADFGLARLMSRDESRVVTLAKGTPGYMAPEFWVGGNIHLSTKADVYSFGMVLLELVSGRCNFALGCRRFPALAFEAAMRGDFESIVDVRLQVVTPAAAATEEQRFLMWQQVRTAVFVALWCIQERPASRPCMSEVVQYLEGIAAVSEQPPWPAIAATSSNPPSPRIGLNDSSSHIHDVTQISGGR